MRIAGAYGIVWVHTLTVDSLRWTEVLGRVGVPLFAASASFFCVQSALRRAPKALGSYAEDRMLRLIVPFGAWSLIYIAARALKPLITGSGVLRLDYTNLYSGTALHLWFLPFLFVATVLLYTLARALRDWPRVFAGTLFALGVPALIPPTNWLDTVTLPRGYNPAAFTIFTLGFDCGAALLLGGALAAWLSGRSLSSVIGASWRMVGYACIGIAVGLVAWSLVIGRTNSVENIAGVLLLIVGLLPYDGPWVRHGAVLGSAAFGVYLCHFLFLDGMRTLVPTVIGKVFRIAPFADTWWWNITTFVAACELATVTTIALCRSRWTAWLVG